MSYKFDAGLRITLANGIYIFMSQFFQVFFDEAEEGLAEMEKLLLAVNVASPDPEDLNAVFRAAHSIKGGSSTFGLTDIAEVTHVLESLLDRIRRLGSALLAAREVEILGEARQGPIRSRIRSLIDDVLQPYERRWFGRPRTGDVVIRVKDLRVAILPELLRGNLSPQETRERWKVLTNCYYCQTLSLYPEGYLDPGERGSVTPERIVETVHRLEEDLTDRVTLRPEWRVHFRIGEPIPAEAGRKPRGEDPLLKELRQRMLQLLGIQDWWPMDPMTVLEEQPAAGLAVAGLGQRDAGFRVEQSVGGQGIEVAADLTRVARHYGALRCGAVPGSGAVV